MPPRRARSPSQVGPTLARGARAAVPGWARAQMTVSVREDGVTVGMRPPSALAALGRRLEVHSSAAVAAP